MGIKRTWSVAMTPCPFQQCQPQLPWVFLQVGWGQGDISWQDLRVWNGVVWSVLL